MFFHATVENAPLQQEHRYQVRQQYCDRRENDQFQEAQAGTCFADDIRTNADNTAFPPESAEGHF